MNTASAPAKMDNTATDTSAMMTAKPLLFLAEEIFIASES